MNQSMVDGLKGGRIFTPIIILGFVVSMGSGPVLAQSDETPNLAAIVARALESADQIEAWSCDLEVSVLMSGMTLKQSGPLIVRGDEMSGDFVMDTMGMKMAMKMITDKDGILWMEMNMLGMPMVTKMDMNAIGRDGENSAAGAMGGGQMAPAPMQLLEGLKEAGDLEFKATEPFDEIEVHVFEGSVNESFQKMVGLINGMGLMDSKLESMRLALGKEDGIPRRLDLLDAAGKSIIGYAYHNLKLNPKIADDQFVYTPPEGAQVTDMTQMARSMAPDAAEGQMLDLSDIDLSNFDLSELNLDFDSIQESLNDMGIDLNDLGNLTQNSSAVGEAQTEAFKTKVAVGNAALDFEGPGLDDSTVRLADFKGKVVLLDFWASWCAPCTAEMPNVVKTYERYHERGFEIIGISLDSSREKLDAYLKEHPEIKWPQIFDAKGWKAQVGRLYGVNAIPYTCLIDSSGRIRHIRLRGDALDKAVKELLDETQKAI